MIQLLLLLFFSKQSGNLVVINPLINLWFMTPFLYNFEVNILSIISTKIILVIVWSSFVMTHKIRDDVRDRESSSKCDYNGRRHSIDGHKEWRLQKSVLERRKHNVILINKITFSCPEINLDLGHWSIILFDKSLV